MASRKVSRRRFVAGTAGLSATMVAAPFVRGAHAAGKLSLGLWDHWVPGANKASEAIIKEWAEQFVRLSNQRPGETIEGSSAFTLMPW